MVGITFMIFITFMGGDTASRKTERQKNYFSALSAFRKRRFYGYSPVHFTAKLMIVKFQALSGSVI